jgi:phosphohistidine phosphatase
MDLILWRHAEAQDAQPGMDDLQRALTPKGGKDATRIGVWLDRHLPEDTRVLCSPAVRCEQTVAPLGRKHKVHKALAPGASAQELLDAAGWPSAKHPVLVVGHQPVLGEIVAQLVGAHGEGSSVRKGAAWWLRTRERDGDLETIVIAVMPPELA